MIYNLADLRTRSGLDGEFGTYETLDDFRHHRCALRLLRCCAYIVAPIMRRRGWAVLLLSELPPDDDCLGKSYFKRQKIKRRGRTYTSVIPQRVCLQLRYEDEPDLFVDIADFMRTLLHELAHFEFRNHFCGFYGFHDHLLAELEQDILYGKSKRRVTSKEISDLVAETVEIRWTMWKDTYGLARKLFRQY